MQQQHQKRTEVNSASILRREERYPQAAFQVPASGARSFIGDPNLKRVAAAAAVRSVDRRPIMSTTDAVNLKGTDFIAGVSAIAPRYDAFLLDQFGVLHDGSQALPGAVSCFNELTRRGARCFVLSNTSRRRADAIKKLAKLGFNASALVDFVCSGEEAWQHMARHCTGQKVLWLGWEDDYLGFDKAGYLTGLDVTLTTLPEEADVVLAQGTQLIRSADGHKAVPTALFASGVVDERLQDTLKICQERRIPMICANPDFQATQPDGSIGYMPGVVSQYYESIGGRVFHFGKPFPAAYKACLSQLPGVPRERICMVGDSLLHDIKGANDNGIDSLFIASGIHVAELPTSSDDLAFADALRVLCKKKSVADPTSVAHRFVW